MSAIKSTEDIYTLKIIIDSYFSLISLDNLFQAWGEFRKGKRNKKDVQLFGRHLEDNLFDLHSVLKNKNYKHSSYFEFFVNDPKRRHIHKACVRDRVVHHLLYKYLYELFDKSFAYDSYSCRIDKGTHRAVKRLEKFTRIASNNYTKPCWALKLDIKKFFANIDHEVLLRLLKRKIKNLEIIRLIGEIINSFHSEAGERKGIPLGNLTSQVFANIYMNELDQFIKHVLKVKHYLRYADDFLLLSTERKELENYILPISIFLQKELKLELHPNKIIIRKLDWGIDFLGYIILPHYQLPRTKTKRRVLKKLKEKIDSANFNQSLQSYLGYLSHANSYKLTQELKSQVWWWRLIN